jgi:membrane protease YdiL (CAAX protease family)
MGGVVLGLTLWPIEFWLLTKLDVGVADWQRPLLELIAESFRRLPDPIKVTLVVVPAILEEWFFRGYLFGALRRRLSACRTVLVTAILFGLMHVLFRMEIGYARFLPSALMGLVLGATREVSGSLWPGMLLHAVHNATLVLLPGLTGASAADDATVETWWVAAGAAGTAVGVTLLWLGRRDSGEPVGTSNASVESPRVA